MATNMQSTPSQTSINQILYLFTSTEYPYYDDMLDLLSYPSNTTYRFRYDLKYLAEDLRNQSALKSLEGETALLIHVHTEPKPANAPAPIIEHFPIREAEILEVKFMGSFVWFQFLLKDWVKYDSTERQYHDKMVAKMPDNMKTKLTHLVIKALPIEFCKVEEDISKPYDHNDVIISWSNLVTSLLKTGKHDKSIFTKFLSIEEIEKLDTTKMLKPKKISDKLYGFSLERKKSYRIEILQRAKANPPKKFNLQVSTNEGQILPIKKTSIIQGKYDILSLIISAAPLVQSLRSFLMIEPEKDAPEGYIIPKMHFNLEISVSRKRKIALSFILGIGIFLTGLSAFAIALDETSPLGLILPAIGATITGLMVYLLPRN